MGTTQSHLITCSLGGLHIGNCQNVDRADVLLSTFSSNVPISNQINLVISTKLKM